MKVLAEHGIDIFNTNQSGLNVLHLAAKMNNYKIVKMLVLSDYPLDLVNNKGQTAFFLAAAKGNTKICKILLKYGADINRTDDLNIGPLYMAILNKHHETAEYLISEGA